MNIYYATCDCDCHKWYVEPTTTSGTSATITWSYDTKNITYVPHVDGTIDEEREIVESVARGMLYNFDIKE